MLPLKKYILAAIASAVVCSQTLVAPSLADSPQFRRVEISGAINAATLYVHQDRDKWTHISDHKSVPIPLHVDIEMSKGYIVYYRVGRNLTDGAVRDMMLTHNGTNSGTLIYANIDSRSTVNGPFNFFVGQGSRLNPTDEQAIISRCNSKLEEIDSGHHFSYSLPLALHADATRRRRPRFPPQWGDDYVAFGDSARGTATGSVSLRIECMKFSKPPKRATTPPSTIPGDDDEPRDGNDDIPKTTDNQDLSLDHGAMKVENIRLTFTTFSNGGYTEPNPGTRCKKARLRVRMETNQEGPVPFKLWQRRGDQPIFNDDYTATSQHDGNGRFFAVKDFEVRVYKTTLVAANSKELISETFQQESGWRDILLICESSGGTGGLANPSDNDDRDLPKPQLKGNFQYLDNGRGATQNKCERTAKAFVWFNNNRPDNIHYSLDCHQSGSFSGVVQPAPIGDGKYRASDIISIPITTSINESCTLRTVAPGSPRDHATLDRTFICHGTAGHESGGGLVGTQQPTHNDPVRLGDGKPTIKTAPIRQDDSVLIGRNKRAEEETRRKRREQAAKKAREAERKRTADARRKAATAERKRRANAERKRKADAERKRQARKRAAKRVRNQAAKQARKRAAKRARDAQRKRTNQTRRNSAGPKRKNQRRTNQRRCPRGKRFIRGRCVRPAG